MKEGYGRINKHTYSIKLIYKKNRTLCAIFLYMSKKSSTFAPAFDDILCSHIYIAEWQNQIESNFRFDKRDVAQPGSATVWGTGGRKFKSCHPDKCSCDATAFLYNNRYYGTARTI